ncbi:MAG: DUF4199 domain-containing protein [Saprospiraceae bacterium]
MENHSVKFGFWAGLLQVLIMLSLYFVDRDAMLLWSSLIGYVVIIYGMSKAVTATRKDHGGGIKFSEAFKAGWLTFILGTTIIVVFTYILMNHIDPTLSIRLKELLVEVLRNLPDMIALSGKELETQIDMINATESYGLGTIAFSLPFSFVIPGAIFAAIIAFVYKKSIPDHSSH